MNTQVSRSDDPIIQAVIDFNSRYKNRNYGRGSPTRIGLGDVYGVSFQGQGEHDDWYMNYVFKRKDNLRVYESLERLVADPANRINQPWWSEVELIRFIAIFILTIFMAVAVVYLVMQPTKNDNLQYLTSVLGLLVGWLVGKSPTLAQERS